MRDDSHIESNDKSDCADNFTDKTLCYAHSRAGTDFTMFAGSGRSTHLVQPELTPVGVGHQVAEPAVTLGTKWQMLEHFSKAEFFFSFSEHAKVTNKNKSNTKKYTTVECST